MDFAKMLAEVRARRRMRELSERSGIGYSYITKLAEGRAPVENIGPGTRLLLEQTMRVMLEQAQAEAAKAAAPSPG